MAKTAKLSTIKKKHLNKYTLEGSLADLGYSRAPGAFAILSPFREPNGEYRTGLNPKATYIDKMPQGEQEIERQRVQEELDYLTKETHLDLSPRSDYYTKIYDSKIDTAERARRVKVKDDVVFNLADPYTRITWAWVRVHPDVAPSYEAFLEGRVSSTTEFYIQDEEHEERIAFNKRSKINKASLTLEGLSEPRRLRVAKLLGLPVTFRSRPEKIYSELDKFIKEDSIKQDNIGLFHSVVNMNDDNLEVRYLIQEALDLSVYRLQKGKIHEGAIELFKNQEDAESYLSSAKGQEDYLALKEKVDAKRKIEIAE